MSRWLCGDPVAMVAATTAMSAERIVASCTWVFCQAEWNQRSEKPDQKDDTADTAGSPAAPAAPDTTA